MLQNPEEVSVQDVLARASHPAPLAPGDFDAVSLCLEGIILTTYSDDPAAASAAARGLGKVEYAGAHDDLFDKALARLTVLFAHDYDPSIRKAAAEACSELISKDGAFGVKILPVLKQSLADGNPEARLQKLIAYGRCEGLALEDAVKTILREFPNYPQPQRAEAMDALGKSFNYDNKPQLRKSVDEFLIAQFDETQSVSEKAMRSYRNLHVHDQLEAMRVFYDAVERLPSGARASLYRLLSEPQCNKAREENTASIDVAFSILCRGVDDPDPVALRAALHALTRFVIRLAPEGDKRTLDAVRGFLQTPDPELRYLASLALLNAGIRTKAAVDSLRTAISDLDTDEMEPIELTLMEERFADTDGADSAAGCFIQLLRAELDFSRELLSVISAFSKSNADLLSEHAFLALVNTLLDVPDPEASAARRCLSGLSFGPHIFVFRRAAMGLALNPRFGAAEMLSDMDFSKCPDVLEDVLAAIKVHEACTQRSAQRVTSAEFTALLQNRKLEDGKEDIIEASFTELPPESVPVAAGQASSENQGAEAAKVVAIRPVGEGENRSSPPLAVIRGLVRGFLSSLSARWSNKKRGG